MIDFPSNLPQPSVKISYAPQGGVISSQMDSGRIRQRRRNSSLRMEYNVSMILTNAGLGLFEAFVYHTLSGGATPFRLKVPSGGSIDLPQEGIIPEGNFNVKAASGNKAWEVSFKFFVYNAFVLSEDSLEILAEVDMNQLNSNPDIFLDVYNLINNLSIS